jgi:hypothetical protein
MTLALAGIEVDDEYSSGDSLVRALEARSPFRYELKKVKDRLMIQGKCLLCGAGKLVSSFDGSLALWEEQHDCRNQKKKPSRKKGKLIPFRSLAKRCFPPTFD